VKLAFGFKMSSFLIIGFWRSFLVFPSVVSQVCNLKSNKLEFRYRNNLIFVSTTLLVAIPSKWNDCNAARCILSLCASAYETFWRDELHCGILLRSRVFGRYPKSLPRVFFYLFFLPFFMTLNRWIYMYDE